MFQIYASTRLYGLGVAEKGVVQSLMVETFAWVLPRLGK